MSFMEEAQKLGFDTADAMERFMNNETLFKTMIKKLPQTIYPSRYGGKKEDDLEFISLLEQGNVVDAVSKAHMLKGMMSNISATAFYKAYTQIVADLRAGKPEEALLLAKRIQPPLDELLRRIELLKDVE